MSDVTISDSMETGLIGFMMQQGVEGVFRFKHSRITTRWLSSWIDSIISCISATSLCFGLSACDMRGVWERLVF
jgi:hypothetical protein